MSHIHNTRGNIICLCRNKFLLMKGMKLFKEDFKCLYLLPCTRNPSDFELPIRLICLLRSYPWPFYNELNGTLINLFNKTFPGKGLKRNCTHHEGCFEMIGERNSKQSTSSLLVLPEKVDEHQYFREIMNLNLLPYSKNLINELMEQSIVAGYSCGECIMNYMKQNLCKKDAKSLCYNSIITQRNFFNSVHIDKRSVFSCESQNKIIMNMKNDICHKRRYHASRYITSLLDNTDNSIPKSTTCCWKLSKYYDDYSMFQYFISPQYMFGIDISSNVLKDNMDVGATFLSSLFYHCTTIPIWTY